MKAFVSSVTAEGQVTIPVDVQRQLGVHGSDEVAFIVTDAGTVEIRPTRWTLEAVLGSIPALPNETPDLDREIEEATEEQAERIVRRMQIQ